MDRVEHVVERLRSSGVPAAGAAADRIAGLPPTAVEITHVAWEPATPDRVSDADIAGYFDSLGAGAEGVDLEH